MPARTHAHAGNVIASPPAPAERSQTLARDVEADHEAERLARGAPRRSPRFWLYFAVGGWVVGWRALAWAAVWLQQLRDLKPLRASDAVCKPRAHTLR